MTRHELRVKHRRTRRIVATLTAFGAVGLGVGMAAPAGAANYHSQNSCQGNYYTAWLTTPARDFSPGQARHACD